MKITCATPEINLNSFHNFIKMNLEEKARTVAGKATWLDEDYYENTIVNLYFLDGFYIEETVSSLEKKVTDIIPFKRGYKIERILQSKGLIEITRRK